MKFQRLSLIVLALCGAVNVALAQPNEAPNQVPGNEAYYYEHPWERHQGPYDRRWYDERERYYRENRIPGVGPDRDLRIGQRLSPNYRNRQYSVEDWRGHQLTPPPRGYRWYQVGPDYVLVDPNGRIAQSRSGRR